MFASFSRTLAQTTVKHRATELVSSNRKPMLDSFESKRVLPRGYGATGCTTTISIHSSCNVPCQLCAG